MQGIDVTVLVGVQSLDFVGRDGKPVKGHNIFWDVQIPERYGSGRRCEKAFVREGTLSQEELKKLVPGARVRIYWNQYGSLAGLDFAEK